MTRRIVFVIALAAALAVPLAAPSSAATPVLASWKSALGSSGYNGTATLLTNATGTGTFRIAAKRLTPRVSYPVELRVGGCGGTRIGTFTSTVSSATGTIARSFTLTTTQAAAAVRYGSKLYARIGSSTRVRCGFLAGQVPTGATSGMTIRVPAGKYSGGVELFTVQAFEPWTPEPGSSWQPDPGNVFVTALVRVEAVTETGYNPFYFNVRAADGLEYGHTIGRDPALHSGDLAPGDFVAGWLTFEVPAMAATGLTLIYSRAFGVTVRVRLTPLASSPGAPIPTPSPTPTPSPAAAACVPGGPYVCMGQTINFGFDAFTVDWITSWAGTSTVKPSAGKVFVAVSVTYQAPANITPSQLRFSVVGPSAQTGYPLPAGRTPAFEMPVAASPYGIFEWGYLTFEVSPSDATLLMMSVRTTVVQLY